MPNIAVGFTGDTSQLNAAIAALNQRITELGGNRGVPELSQHIDKVRETSERAAVSLEGMGRALEHIKSRVTELVLLRVEEIFARMAEGIFEVGKQSIDAAAHMQSMQITLASFLGSAKEAREVVAELQAYAPAHGSLFTSTQLLESFQTFMSIGSMNRADAMSSVKDMVALTTAYRKETMSANEQLQGITMQFAEGASAGMITGGHLRSLRTLGLPVANMLAAAIPVDQHLIDEKSEKEVAAQEKVLRLEEAMRGRTTDHGPETERRVRDHINQIDRAMTTRDPNSLTGAMKPSLLGDETKLGKDRAELEKLQKAYDDLAKSRKDLDKAITPKGQMQQSEQGEGGLPYANVSLAAHKFAMADSTQDLVEKRAKDFQGLSSAIADYFQMLQIDFSTPLLQPLQDAMSDLANTMKDMGPTATAWGYALANWLTGAWAMVKTFYGSLADGSFWERFGLWAHATVTTVIETFRKLGEQIASYMIKSISDGSLLKTFLGFASEVYSVLVQIGVGVATNMELVAVRMMLTIVDKTKEAFLAIPAFIRVPLEIAGGMQVSTAEAALSRTETVEQGVDNFRSRVVDPQRAMGRELAHGLGDFGDKELGRGIGQMQKDWAITGQQSDRDSEKIENQSHDAQDADSALHGSAIEARQAKMARLAGYVGQAEEDYLNTRWDRLRLQRSAEEAEKSRIEQETQQDKDRNERAKALKEQTATDAESRKAQLEAAGTSEQALSDAPGSMQAYQNTINQTQNAIQGIRDRMAERDHPAFTPTQDPGAAGVGKWDTFSKFGKGGEVIEGSFDKREREKKDAFAKKELEDKKDKEQIDKLADQAKVAQQGLDYLKQLVGVFTKASS
jgi:hypothetical protein